MKHALARTFAVSALSILLAGQAALAQEVPFQGVVVQDDTKVRAGAGRAYYIVGELDQGAVVSVEEVIFGWNKIGPPGDVYSYVQKVWVDQKGAGGVGIVNNDRTEVKAGSLKGPGESYRGQLVLNKGDRVEILGEEGNFWKIRPPQGAYVFLPPGSVRRANPGEIGSGNAKPAIPAPAGSEPEIIEPDAERPAAPVATVPPTQPVTPPPAPETPVAPPTPTPAVVVEAPPTPPTVAADPEMTPPATTDVEVAEAPTPATTTTTAAQAPEAPATPEAPLTPAQQEQVASQVAPGGAGFDSRATSERLRALESKMLPEFAKPLEEQPIAEMIREYEIINRQPLPAVDRQIVRMRLAALKRNQGYAETLKQIRETQQNLTPAEEVQQIIEATPSYDAVGRLLASSVYNGQNLPLRFRLVDPSSGRTLAWVQPGGVVEPRQHLGRLVGVVGSQEYDPGVKANVLAASRIDVLEPATGAPAGGAGANVTETVTQ